MKISLATAWSSPNPEIRLPGKKDQFRKRFQRSVRECIRHGFSMEESFGVIWNETLDENPLTETQEFELYQEMLAWAKQYLLTGTFSTSSQELSTRKTFSFGETTKSYWVIGRI